MADIRLAAVIRYLHRLADPSAIADQSDAVLLGRLAAQRDPAAFEMLLRRHGPLVWRVCRRVLHREQDAEDAFQATFLALARHVKSIRKPESLTSFLHGTAYRIARRLQEGDRRRSSAREIPPSPVSDPSQEASWRELGRIVEEEVHALPEKLRTALLLCYWEGLTNEEAARRLGCPCGTLKARLAKARKLLHDYLIRRGVTLPAGAITLLLAPGGGEAAVPLTLAMRTASMAGASPRVAALVEGGLQSMTLSRVKIGLVLLVVGTIASGMGVLAHRAPVAEQAPAVAEKEDRDTRTRPAKEHPTVRTDLHGDPLPERAIARLGTVRFRMDGLAHTCAWSPDGKTLAAAGGFDRDVVSLFDDATGKPLRQLHTGHLTITSLAYSPDGRTLASGSQGEIVLWSPATGKLLRRWDSNRGQGKQIWSLTFTPDGKGLISAGEGARIHLWDPATGQVIRQFTGHEKDVRCAVLSPDGHMLASAADKEIRLWETATGKMIRRLTGQKEPIRALAFSPDGKLLASGGAGFSGTSSIWLWETATGKVHLCLPEDKEFRKGFTMFLVRALAFSPDGKTLAAGYLDNTLRFWDVATGKKLHEMPGVGTYRMFNVHDGGIQGVAFSGDGKRLAFTRENQIALLDVPSGKVIQSLPAPPGAMERVFFSPNGKRLFTTNWALDQQFLEWDATSGRLIRQLLPGKLLAPHLVRFSSDRKIMFTSMWDDTSQLRDTITGEVIRPIPLPIKTKNYRKPGDLAFSPDGKLLAVEEFFGKAVWLIDAATGKRICTVEGMKSSKEEPCFLTFSPDGRLLAMADRATIHLAEAPSGRQLPPIVLPKGYYAYSVAISPDGRTLAIPCYGDFTGQAMLLLETATGKERLVLPGPLVEVACAAFSPDGRLLAAGGRGRAVLVWDMIACKEVARLEGHQGYVKSLAFSPNGRRLASGSQDTTALIWDVSGLAKELPRRNPLTREERNELWSTLGSADAAKAYQAILTLESLPDQSVPLLAERLRLKPVADAKRIARLLAQLDSESFQERERATKELREIGWAAEPALHKALEGEPSAEVRRRVKVLLDSIREQTLRMLRGIEVLERIGTTEAKKVLRELAGRAPETRLTREAKASLDRLARP